MIHATHTQSVTLYKSGGKCLVNNLLGDPLVRPISRRGVLYIIGIHGLDHTTVTPTTRLSVPLVSDISAGGPGRVGF